MSKKIKKKYNVIFRQLCNELWYYDKSLSFRRCENQSNWWNVYKEKSQDIHNTANSIGSKLSDNLHFSSFCQYFFLIKHLWYMHISFLRKKTRILFSTSVILFTRTFHWYLNFEIILMNKFIKKLCVIKLLKFLFIWKGNIKIIYRNVLDLDISNICSMKLWFGFAYFVKFCHCVLMKI